MATVAPAVAERVVVGLIASVPLTCADNAIAPFVVARQVQLNEVVLFPARFCEPGFGPERICAAPVPVGMARDGLSALTPTPPVSVTVSSAVKVSPRRAAAGAESEATSADGVCTAIGAEVT